MSDFEFATATRIIFGEGKLREIATIAPEFGQRALVVVGGTVERAKILFDLLDQARIAYIPFAVASEPDIELITNGVTQAIKIKAELVIAFGGGAVIDAGKAIAVLATNPGEVIDYLEVIGSGKKLINPPLPFIAIPTTAGTGAEVTRNSVISSPAHKLKVSLRSPLMLPRVALVDPELTYSLPKQITAYTGMDALTQVIEPFTSNAANPLTNALCREGIQRGVSAIQKAYHDGDLDARHDMSLVTLFGGLALANARLGAVHGFAGVLGGMYGAPHGALCARLLPFVTAANIQALKDRAPQHPALYQYNEIAAMIGLTDTTSVIDWLGDLVETITIPTLSYYGISREDFPDIVQKSARSSSMKGNPIVLTSDELTAILEKAL